MITSTFGQFAEELADYHERIAIIEVVAIDDTEWLFDDVLAHKHGMIGAPWLDTTFGHSKSLGQGIDALEAKLARHSTLILGKNLCAELLLKILTDNEYNFAESGTQSIIDAVENCGFWESIPLWAVTLIGGLFITVLSFVMIMTVYGRFFKIYMYAAIAPIPLSTFAGEPTQNTGKTFLKSYCAVLLEGAIIALACIIFSVFAASPPVVDTSAAAVTQVWAYVGELIFNLLVLVGAVKMADRIVREMMGL